MRFRQDGTNDVLRTDDALIEWGRWCRWGSIGPRAPACGSLESSYRSGQVWEVEEPREEDPDWRVGERIERVVTRLPARHRQALKAWYVSRPAIKAATGLPLVPDDEMWCARRIQINNVERWRLVLDEARTMVEGGYR
jgi:hypothetical protein